MLDRIFLVSLLAVFMLLSSSQAAPGPAPFGTATGEYNPVTGEITVSVHGVKNWYVERVDEFAMTGEIPFGLPTTGELISDNDDRIGVSVNSPLAFIPPATNLSLGNVAQTFLPNDGELKIFWNVELGEPLQMQSLEIGDYNYPPIVQVETPSVVDIVNDSLSIMLDASGTTDDGKTTNPLSYRWDLDGDNVFEFDTGAAATLSIANVTSTFGGQGDYPVVVKVFDGEYWAVNSTTVSLSIPQPEPVTPVLPAPPPKPVVPKPETQNLATEVAVVPNESENNEGASRIDVQAILKSMQNKSETCAFSCVVNRIKHGIAVTGGLNAVMTDIENGSTLELGTGPAGNLSIDSRFRLPDLSRLADLTIPQVTVSNLCCGLVADLPQMQLGAVNRNLFTRIDLPSLVRPVILTENLSASIVIANFTALEEYGTNITIQPLMLGSVPEPASLIHLALGLMLVIATRRKRNASFLD